MAFFDPAVGQIKGVAGLISFFQNLLQTPHPQPLSSRRGVPTAQLLYSFFLYKAAGNL
jgi:hypothetical protein